MKKDYSTENRIVCLRCSYSWNYNSKTRKPRFRIRCPICHSSQNEYNRDLFGRFIGL